jgi:hypothetical protein
MKEAPGRHVPGPSSFHERNHGRHPAHPRRRRRTRHPRSARRLSRQERLRVTKAESAAAARRLLAAHAIDLILLDIMMPGEDGLSLAGFVRATTGTPGHPAHRQGRGDGPDRRARAGRRRLCRKAVQPARAPRPDQGGASPIGGLGAAGPRARCRRLCLRPVGAEDRRARAGRRGRGRGAALDRRV